MIVYRVIEDVYSYGIDGNLHNEYKDYLNGIISMPKQNYNDGWNTHQYKGDNSYLHFFHFYESAIEYVMGIPSMGWDGRTYIASYNIPIEILEEFIGFGYYPDAIHSNKPFLEYAVPFSRLNNEFINDSIVKYSSNLKFSKEYIEYIEYQHNKYLEKIPKEDQKLIKSLCGR